MSTPGSTAPHRVARTATTMADGRDLIYFDDSEPYVSGGATRRLDDPRPLGDRFPPSDGDGPPPGPEMRLDPLTGEWIPMASHRMNRTFLPAADACPLCPARPEDGGTGYSDGEVPDTDYDVVVFENRFPALMQIPGVTLADGWLVDGEPLHPALPAAGRFEVVCFSADHTSSFAQLTTARVRTVIEAWVDRTVALSDLPGIEQVYCFENRGKEIGVTLPHPHGQIYAFPFVAPRTRAMLRQAAASRDRTGGHLLHDVVEAERRARTRVVLDSEHWVAYVPSAARWPVEVHLAPKRDVLDLAGLTEAERADLAVTYLELLRRLDRFFVEPGEADAEPGEPPQAIPLPYIAGWHQAVVGEGRELGRLHLQVFSVLRAPGKLKYLAGVESGVAAWISDTTPERIATRLQEVAR